MFGSIAVTKDALNDAQQFWLSHEKRHKNQLAPLRATKRHSPSSARIEELS